MNDRREDIPLLVDYFLKLVSEESGQPAKKVTKEALLALQNVNWTGNIRELRNVVERLVILSGDKITEEDVLRYVIPNSAKELSEFKKIFDKFKNLDEVHQYIDQEYSNYKTT